MTAIIGKSVTFHCAGVGFLINWNVNEKHHDDPAIKACMIYATQLCTSMADVVCSNLTVPATVKNNGTTLQCCITSFHDGATCSNNVTFTVRDGKYSNYVIIDFIHSLCVSASVLLIARKHCCLRVSLTLRICVYCRMSSYIAPPFTRTLMATACLSFSVMLSWLVEHFVLQY